MVDERAKASTGLTQSLKILVLNRPNDRTPLRVDGRSLNYDVMEEQAETKTQQNLVIPQIYSTQQQRSLHYTPVQKFTTCSVAGLIASCSMEKW